MEYLGDVSKKVEDFIRKSDQFQTACNSAFDQVDVRGLGSIPISHVALATVYFFRDVSTAVDDFGIKVKEPTAEEVKKILLDNGFEEGDDVSRAEFETLYVAILKYAAVKCAVGFAQKYGVGMAVGFTAVLILKKAIRAVPVVGGIAKPILSLLPAPLLGPLLGILGVYAADRGDLADVRHKLFGDKKGQFKSG
uniref:Uncharacterized protein n=1 Tax=Tetradesmus obliquus TaxID=3088 RepID=A0A383WFM1_TETOB|eukprot:jgi/Sobl393_1/894/SZX75556.1